MKLQKSQKNSQSTKIFNGRKEADKILASLKKKISEQKLFPVLAVILVGQDKSSKLYIKLKKRAAEKIGAKLILYEFKKESREKELINLITKLNKSKSVSGIIVQLPLPKGINPNNIIKLINPKKDVDGFLKNSPFEPVLPAAIFFTFKKAVKCLKLGSKHSFKGEKRKSFDRNFFLALVNSEIFGETLKEFFNKKGIKINYFLNRIISKKELAKKIRMADLVVSVCGVPNLIKGDIIKKDSLLIDAGITYISDKKIVGDVKTESVKEKVSFLSPVPGGLGPLTVALLLKNLYLAEKKFNNQSKNKNER